MFIDGLARPLSALEELELRRERLQELITLKLVSPSLSEQIQKTIAQLDVQLATQRQQLPPVRLAA